MVLSVGNMMGKKAPVRDSECCVGRDVEGKAYLKKSNKAKGLTEAPVEEPAEEVKSSTRKSKK